jgi:hypothetical protein
VDPSRPSPQFLLAVGTSPPSAYAMTREMPVIGSGSVSVKSQCRDQALHFFVGLAATLPAVWGHYWAGPVLVGLAREIEQMVNKGDWDWGLGRSLDMVFWALAGLAVQIVGWIV